MYKKSNTAGFVEWFSETGNVYNFMFNLVSFCIRVSKSGFKLTLESPSVDCPPSRITKTYFIFFLITEPNFINSLHNACQELFK